MAKVEWLFKPDTKVTDLRDSLDRVLFPTYHVALVGDEVRIKKPIPFKKDSHRQHIGIYHPIKGWAATHRFINTLEIDGEIHEFWDVMNTGYCGWTTPHEAYREAMGWAIDEDLPLVIMTKEELDKLAEGGDA